MNDRIEKTEQAVKSCADCDKFKNKNASGKGWCAFFEFKTKCHEQACMQFEWNNPHEVK